MCDSEYYKTLSKSIMKDKKDEPLIVTLFGHNYYQIVDKDGNVSLRPMEETKKEKK
jgi:hypothetical protein